MEYPVIVEKNNGTYRALIPALAALSAEGQSPDEAVEKLQQSAESYLAAVEVRTINLQMPQPQTSRYSTAQDWLEAVSIFEGDDEAIREHFAELEAERLRQSEEAHKREAA